MSTTERQLGRSTRECKKGITKPAVRAKRASRMGRGGQGQACMRDETTRRKSRPERSRYRHSEAALRRWTLRLHMIAGPANGADHCRSSRPGRGTSITGDGLGRANAPTVSQLRPPLAPLTAPRGWRGTQHRTQHTQPSAGRARKEKSRTRPAGERASERAILASTGNTQHRMSQPLTPRRADELNCWMCVVSSLPF